MARFALYVLTLFAAVYSTTARAADCPDRPKMMERVLAIEASDEQADKKIVAFSSLIASYSTCKLPKDSVYARILHRLGDLHRQQGNFEKGISLTEEAVKINSTPVKTSSRSFLTHSYYNLGIYHGQLSDYDNANEYFDSCISIGSQFHQKMYIVLMAYEQKSFAYFKTGEYQKSLEAADQGIIIAGKTKDTAYEGILLQQKAQSQLALGIEREAEVNAKMAVQILERSDVPKEYLASAFATYARVVLVQNNPALAIQYYNKSIALNRDLKNWTQCSRDYMDLGYLYDYTLRDSARAIKCYTSGLAVLGQSPDPYLKAALLSNLGVVHWRNGDHQKALTFYQCGLNTVPINFTDTALSSNPSGHMIKLVSNDHFVATLLENKGDALLASYKKSASKHFLHDALKAYRSADKVIDQMRRRQVRETSKLFWREKTRKMYENAIETCYLLNDLENAFFFFEKSRAVLLNDKLNELGASKILTAQDSQEERKLRSQLYSIQNRLQEPNLTSATKTEVQQKWYTTQQKLEKYIRRLEGKYPQYFQYKYDTTNYALKDIRETLNKEDRTLIEYFTSDSVIYSLTIGPTNTSFDKVNFKSFRETVNEYVALCSSPSLNRSYERFTHVSHLLYNNLFKELPVKTKRVIVSFDDYFIPFESLLKHPDLKTSFLLKDHIFLYIYSAAYILRNKNISAFDNSILGVAPVWYENKLNLSPLKGAEISLRKIESCFRESFSMIKETATKRSFMDKFPNYSIVHVYSHAMADYSGEEPMLYFHDDPVKLRDLQMLPEVKTKMLVLSGCRTGIGKTIKGEGVLSLARGFASAGIPSIVTTLWSVDDKVTYDIMEKFYKHMQSGLASDEALQRAKIDFLDANDGENELPYYWASSVALGKSMTMSSAQANGIRIWQILLSLTAILSLAAFLFRSSIRRWTIARQ